MLAPALGLPFGVTLESVVLSHIPNLTPSVLATLIRCAVSDNLGLHELSALLLPVTSLLPPQEIDPLTLSNMRVRMLADGVRAKYVTPTPLTPEQEAVVAKLLKSSVPADDEWTAAWPPRSKTDLSLRRVRLNDVVAIYRHQKMFDVLIARISKLGAFDNVFVSNLLLGAICLSTPKLDWWAFYDRFGSFNHPDNYVAISQWLSQTIKKYPCAIPDHLNLIENQNLTGYRNPPFPGFDVFAETESLAHGGGEHGLGPEYMTTFTARARRLLRVVAQPKPYVSLEDWVRQASWETAGASSEGKVEVEVATDDGPEVLKFRARKNVVPDCVSEDGLVDQVLTTSAQENKVLIKAELGKVRLAVSADLPTYLIMSWINYLMGDAPTRWPDSTKSESLVDLLARMDRIMAGCKGWTLPFDFKNFDHQITTEEIKALISIFCDIARDNVPTEARSEFDHVAKRLVDSFDHSTLYARDGEKEILLKVMGGLMSGLFFTSLLGDAWNMVMTDWARDVVNSLTGKENPISFLVRGDDTAIATVNYCLALLMRFSLQTLGAIGHDAKFGIHHGRTEFLRVWYTAERAYGYPARVVPGLTQRKPWNPQPWQQQSVIAALYDQCLTLDRRLAQPVAMDKIWPSLARRWSQLNHRSQTWLQIPATLGGLGVEPWGGRLLPEEPWPESEARPGKVVSDNAWRKKLVTESFSDYSPTEAEVDAVAASELFSKIATDDVPQVNSYLRTLARRPEVQKFASATTMTNDLETAKMLDQIRRQYAGMDSASAAIAAANQTVVGFGVHARLRGSWVKYQQLRRVSKDREPGLKYFAKSDPAFVTAVSALRKQGLSLDQALDYVFGEIQIGPLPVGVHPILVRLIQPAVARCVSTYIHRAKRTRIQYAQLVATTVDVTSRALYASRFSTRYGRW